MTKMNTSANGMDSGELSPPGKKQKRRREWEETHEALSDAYVNFITNKLQAYPNPTMRQPTIAQLAAIAGYSTKTISRHLEDLDRDVNMNRRVKKYRLGSDLIMKAWLRSAIKGNVSAGEKYLQVAEQINFSAIVKIEAPVNEGATKLSNLTDEELKAYKALIMKMVGKAEAKSPSQVMP